MKLYNCAQVRRIDEIAISGGTPAYVLMQRAAAALLREIRQRLQDTSQLLILCGSGNNGGDGYDLARQAHAAGLQVTILWLTSPDRLSGAAREAADAALAAGIACQPFDSAQASAWLNFLSPSARSRTVIVDALLGTGAAGAPRPDYEQAIRWINKSGLPAVAVDIPSGVNADTGYVASVAVRACFTVSMIAPKQGLYTGDAPAYTGERIVDDLQVPASVFAQDPALTPAAAAIDASILRQLPPRSPVAHKGDAGRVLVVGGDNGFGGAVLMSSEAAARAGAGTVSLITRQAHVVPVLARCPEVMVHAVEGWQDEGAERADALLQQASSIVLGPGLGRSEWSHSVLHNVLTRAVSRHVPMVLDADALNLLAAEETDWEELAPAEVRAKWIITPHPGEAARLLGCNTLDIGRDRLSAARALQQRTGCAVILKGAGSVLALPGLPVLEICLEGNAAMASGGMGDVLAGICGALLAQPGLDAAAAARFAVCAHGEAGDLAAAALQANRGVLATDLLRWLPRLLSMADHTQLQKSGLEQ